MNTLTANKKYNATIQLGGIEQFASNKMIADLLIKEGFRDVQVTGTGKTRNAIAISTRTGPIPHSAQRYIKEIVEI